MNTRHISISSLVLIALCQITFGQGVINATNSESLTNLTQLPGAYSPAIGDARSTNAVVPPTPEKPTDASPTTLPFPGETPPPVHTGNPSVSGLRGAIFCLAAVVILPCLLCAAVMIAKENRRAARICMIAAVVFGIASLIALVIVDSLG